MAAKCGGCGKTWNSMGQAHCAGLVRAAFSIRDSEAKFRPNGDVVPLEESPDGGWIVPHLLPNGGAGHTGFVEADGLIRVNPRAVSALMFGGGQARQVAWAVVGFDAIEVVNVLVRRGIGDKPVLVGFDVLPGSDLPSQPHVSVGSRIPLRLNIGGALASSEFPDFRAFVKQSAARGATPPLAGRIWHRGTTVDAGNGGHGAIVAQWECHEQFNSTAAFDRHREGPFTDRSCIPVERFGDPYGKTAKPRLLRTSRADGDVWVTSLREAL